MEELYEQLSVVERERAKMRDISSRFEDENKHQATELEELRIEIVELKKQLELYEDKLSQANIMREDKLN